LIDSDQRIGPTMTMLSFEKIMAAILLVTLTGSGMVAIGYHTWQILRDVALWMRWSPMVRTVRGLTTIVVCCALALAFVANYPGTTIARRIIEGRPYRTVEDLLKVKGIGAKPLAEIRPLVTVR
jgi:hypothetical protein